MARKKKVGRKRIHTSDKSRKRKARALIRPKTESQEIWNRYLEAVGLGTDRGEIMVDAPSDTIGRLETGGFDLDAIQKIANHER